MHQRTISHWHTMAATNLKTTTTITSYTMTMNSIVFSTFYFLHFLLNHHINDMDIHAKALTEFFIAAFQSCTIQKMHFSSWYWIFSLDHQSNLKRTIFTNNKRNYRWISLNQNRIFFDAFYPFLSLNWYYFLFNLTFFFSILFLQNLEFKYIVSFRCLRTNIFPLLHVNIQNIQFHFSLFFFKSYQNIVTKMEELFKWIVRKSGFVFFLNKILLWKEVLREYSIYKKKAISINEIRPLK